MHKILVFILFCSGCAWLNDPVNHGTEFMKRDWAKHRDCGTICDYWSGHMCTAFKLSETECRCGDPTARDSNAQHLIPLEAENFDVECSPDCKSFAAQIRLRQPWRY